MRAKTYRRPKSKLVSDSGYHIFSVFGQKINIEIYFFTKFKPYSAIRNDCTYCKQPDRPTYSSVQSMSEVKLTCAIVDDDEVSRTLIARFAEKAEFLTVEGSYQNPEDALKAIGQEPVDILFLDIEMPEMTGIDLIGALETKPYIILITSREEYAIKAFELEVTDYILKPFNYSRFIKAVNKVKELAKTGVAEAPLPANGTATEAKELYVKHQSRYVKVPYRSIQWVEAIGDYVEIHTDERKYTIHTTMKTVESKLPASIFARVHRSYIVRLDAIAEIEDNTLSLGKKLIPIGKSYRDALMATLNLL